MLDTLLAETMDPAEFEASINMVAAAADDFEKRFGKDIF